MVIDSARRLIESSSMIPKDACVLVAVSGGLDSIVLLDVLVRLSSEKAFSLVVGHIDHGLRGRASSRDAAFVRDVAAQFELSMVSHQLTDHERTLAGHQGREGAARHARYEALQALAEKAGATRIALGHSQDDHAETIVHRLVRGTGPTGLRGIPAVRLPFIRPLLRATRDEILEYGKNRLLTWREDASNADLAYTRNRIRQRILPELKAMNPRLGDALTRSAELLDDLDNAAVSLAARRLNEVCDHQTESEISLHRRELADMPDAVSRLLLREALRRLRGSLEGIEMVHIDTLLDLINGERAHGELSLPGLSVRMQQETVILCTTPIPTYPSWDVPVALGPNVFPDGKRVLDIEIVPVSHVQVSDTQGDPWIELADADCITFPMRVRTRQPGDRFTPLGGATDVKLKDFLIREKAAYFERDNIPLLCDQDRIVWVAGIRLSESVKLSDRTQRVLRMTMKGVE